METLSHTDWQRMHEFLRLLHAPCSLQEFPTQILTSLTSLIGAELFGASSFSMHNTTLPRICTFPNPEVGMAAEAFTAQHQNFWVHPVSHHYFQTRDGQALAISDFLSESEFHRRESLYSGFFQYFGLEDQMLIHFELPSKLKAAMKTDLFHQGQEHIAVSISRSHRNFTERDRLMLNLIRPHLQQAYENIVALSQLQDQLAEQQEATKQISLIALSVDGAVKWMTQQSEEILHQYFPLSNAIKVLPDLLQRWVDHQILKFSRSTEDYSSIRPLSVERDGRRLRIRFSYSTKIEQFYLFLEETEPEKFSIQLLQLLGLTKREAEVLFWVAKDKGIQEISQQLDISQGTTKKHIEHIYQKFGVQTRLGAVMYALRKLDIANF